MVVSVLASMKLLLMVLFCSCPDLVRGIYTKTYSSVVGNLQVPLILKLVAIENPSRVSSIDDRMEQF